MPRRFAVTMPSGPARTLLILGAVTVIATGLGLPAVAAVAGVTALGVPLVAIARRHFQPGSAVTPSVAAVVMFCFAVLAIIELLSLLSLLGSRVAWSAAFLGFAVALYTADGLFSSRAGSSHGLVGVIPVRCLQAEPWLLVTAPVVLALGALFVQSAYLDIFTGINHTDAQSYYMARAIRYLQDGNLSTYSTTHDFYPHLHPALSAYLLLHFGTESAIVFSSAVFGAFVCLTLFELSRLTGVPVSLSLLVGCAPIAIPIFSIHLTTSHFDIHILLFILICIYFLTVAMRVSALRYCVLAACATSLALAMKQTFFFAALGLLILWIVTWIWLSRSHGWSTCARVMAVTAVIVGLGGAHFLRNVVTQGFLISPGTPEQGQASVSSPREALEQLTFSGLASITILMTPSIIVNGEWVAVTENALRSVNESLGIYLPNPRLVDVPGRSWHDVLSHLRTPFESDKAGFGAVFPLAVAPAAAWVVFDAVRRRRFFTLPMYLLAYAGLYLVSIGLSLRYTTSIMRYLIELAVPLLVLVPLLVARLPRAVGMLYLAVVSGFMVADAYQAFRFNEARPPDRVMVVAREDQYPTFFATEEFTNFEGARVLDRKYPVEEWPEIHIFKEPGQPLEYPFLDSQGRRHMPYWRGSLEEAQPAWPGPFLVLRSTVADTLQSDFADQVVLDRLSDQVWLALPRDQLRVLWRVELPDGTRESVVRLRAFAPTSRYRNPQYRFSTIHRANGALMGILRGFARDAQFTLPSSALSRVFDLQVEVREGTDSSTAERIRIPERRMLER